MHAALGAKKEQKERYSAERAITDVDLKAVERKFINSCGENLIKTSSRVAVLSYEMKNNDCVLLDWEKNWEGTGNLSAINCLVLYFLNLWSKSKKAKI